jgi:hypothetical protein
VRASDVTLSAIIVEGHSVTSTVGVGGPSGVDGGIAVIGSWHIHLFGDGGQGRGGIGVEGIPDLRLDAENLLLLLSGGASSP